MTSRAQMQAVMKLIREGWKTVTSDHQTLGGPVSMEKMGEKPIQVWSDGSVEPLADHKEGE